jgi:hypothetical protein
MFAPTSFFADYGCHVRILEEARVLRRLGHQVTIAAHHSGNLVPGLDIRRTLSIPWRRSYVVGSSRHKIVDMVRVAVAPKLSLTEGTGKSLNYMVVGLPAVAFDTPVARECPGLDCALTVRGDVDSLAANLAAHVCLVDTAPAQLRTTSQRWRQRAVQTFSWDKVGRQIVQSYQDVFGGTPAPVAPSKSDPVARRRGRL